MPAPSLQRRRPSAIARPPLVRELLLVAGLFLVYKFGRQLATGPHRRGPPQRPPRVGPGAGPASARRGLGAVAAAARRHPRAHREHLLRDRPLPGHRRPSWSGCTCGAPRTTSGPAGSWPRSPRPPWCCPSSSRWRPRGCWPRPASSTPPRCTAPRCTARRPADHLSNQFAAMPSLHFGWALMVAIGLIVATRSRWRWLWLLHPLVTLLVIVGTANHYWLDAIVATAMLGIALAADPPAAPDRQHRRTRRRQVRTGPRPSGRRSGRGARPGRSGPMNATLVAVALSLVSAVAYAAAAVAQERLASRNARHRHAAAAGFGRLVGFGRAQRGGRAAARRGPQVRPADRRTAAGRAHPGRRGADGRAGRPDGGSARSSGGAPP